MDIPSNVVYYYLKIEMIKTKGYMHLLQKENPLIISILSVRGDITI